MSRLERNIKRRKRRRSIIFSLLLLLLLFISGLLATNNVMVKMVALPNEKNILSINYLKNNVISHIRILPVNEWMTNIEGKATEWYWELKRMFKILGEKIQLLFLSLLIII